MSDPIQTIDPDSLAERTDASGEEYALVFAPGGPIQKMPFGRLLAKLIASDLCKADKATLDADLAHDEDTVALVIHDAIALNNGWYRKIGATGAGNWEQFEILSKAAKAAIDDAVANITAVGAGIIADASEQADRSKTEADRSEAAAAMFGDVRAAVEGAGLPYPTEYEPEAETYFAAAATAGSARGSGIKYVDNRWIKKWKDAGIYSAIRGLWIMDNTLPVSRINIVNPGTYDLIDVGLGPTFNSVRLAAGATFNSGSAGAKATSQASYLDTQIPLSSINPNDFCLGVYATKPAASATWDIGIGDGTAGLGILLADSGNGNRPTVRAMGTAVNAPAPTAPLIYSNTAQGFTAVQRLNSATECQVFHNGIRKGVIPSAAVASASAGTVKIGRALNITTGASNALFRSIFLLSRGLTESEMDLFYRGVRSMLMARQFGAVSIRHAGAAPSKVKADLVLYGWTLQSVLSAYEMARQGWHVALVGGWDDHTLDDIGGVSSNGLGAGDIKNALALGGVMLRVLSRIPQMHAQSAPNIKNFPPQFMNYALRELLDPERTPVAGSISLYETGGVTSVDREASIGAEAPTERRILRFKCEDGTVFEAPLFGDGTYEIDLARSAGVTVTWGTDAAGPGFEAIAGFTGRETEALNYGSGPDVASVGNTSVPLNPYVEAGNPASGLIYSVNPDGGWVKGQPMQTLQNFCLRSTFTNNASLQRPLPLTAPAGYDASKFALQERFFTTAAGMGLVPAYNDLFIPNSLPGGWQDFNNRSALSLDIQESGTRFIKAGTYAARRKLKEEFLDYTDQLIYHFWASPSSAIPAATRTALQGFSYAADHYLDPGPNDRAYKSSGLYVREAWRIVGEMVWTANDLAAADGTAPRSTRIVSCASYDADSHNHFLYVDTSTGTPRIMSGNKMFIVVGNPNFINGTNVLAPLPREIFLPKRSEAANLFVLFGGSWTHVAHGVIRMEFTSAQAGQSFGMLAAIALETGKTAFMDVDDATFRARMAALPEATPAYLPQVN